MKEQKSELRLRAEAKAADLPDDALTLPPKKLREILHELRVHQIELEMQNEELRFSEAQVDAARAKYFELYDLAPVGYCIVDPNGLLVEGNMAAAELLGFSRYELIGQPFSKFLTRGSADAWYLGFKDMLASKGALPLELQLSRDDEARPWVRVEGSVSRDASGAKRIRLVMLDISERKEAERLMAEGKAVLDAILECAGFPAFAVDRQYRYIYFNSAHARIMRSLYGTEPSMGASLADCQPVQEDLAAARKNLDRAFAGESFTESSFLGKEGAERRYLEVSHNPVRVGGQIVGASVFVRDVTHKMDLEDRLRQAQKMEAVGLLAGGVAHDFNNILTAIKCYSGMVMKTLPDGTPSSEDMRELMSAAGRAESLTHQLLAFSRRQIISPRPVDLNTVIGDIVKMLQRIIGEDIRLSARFSSAPCTCMADPGQVAQSVMNLVVNARDAMRNGGEISIETDICVPPDKFFVDRPGLARGSMAVVKISDNGKGMSAEEMSHIFEPFYTTKPKSAGTGLGLSMVYGFVKQSGGDVTAESVPGKGSVFTLYFPLLEAPPAQEPAPGLYAPAVLKGSETILLVEDDEQLLRVGTRLLQENGYPVISASGGEEALAVAEKYGKPVDLLVTDMVMLGMNGRELAKELARRGSIGRTLYMSGYTEDAIVKHGALDPDVAFIGKPFTPEAFLAKLRGVLDGPAGQAKA